MVINMPKASVVIPAYNRSHLLKDTVCAVLSQTEPDLEVIVVDDGSIDDTADVVESINDKRVIYFYKTNGGPASARNLGLSKAKGEYVAFLDHDDKWPHNYLEVMLSSLGKNADFGAAYSPITVVFPDGRKMQSYKRQNGKSGWITIDLFKTGFVWTSAALIRRSALENIWFDDSLNQSYEDGDFFLRLSARTQFVFVEEVEAVKTVHTSNFSAQVGIQPTRILVLERFYFRLGGDEIVPAKIAKRRISHACRKVAEDHRRKKGKAAALELYKRAIKYQPVDFRLYWGLIKTLLLRRKRDPDPDWKMPTLLPVASVH